MGVVYPFAMLGDLVALLSGLALIVMLTGTPSWYTWTKSHGPEEHRVPEDEAVGRSPSRDVYP